MLCFYAFIRVFNKMRLILIIILIILVNKTNGQIPSDSLLKKSFNQTIESYFKQIDSTTNYKDIFIICKLDYSTLIKTVTGRPIVYISDSSMLTQKLRPKRKHYYRNIYTISHKNSNNSSDTIDIDISKFIFLPKGQDFQICGGIGTYISSLPNGRLIFDKKNNSWTYFTNQQMRQQWHNKLKE